MHHFQSLVKSTPGCCLDAAPPAWLWLRMNFSPCRSLAQHLPHTYGLFGSTFVLVEWSWSTNPAAIAAKKKRKKKWAADWLLCQPVGGDTCVAASCCAELPLENEQLLQCNCTPRAGVLQPLWWDAPSQVFPSEAALSHRWPLITKCSYCDLFTGITAHIMDACYVDWEKSFLNNYFL